ncbi:MAG TPA: glycosyltransferase family 2 protein [Candidatus Synoicihabitans sp.]|nr:glycosyltransferase family 2 protein [Candidatus Synoicihabitans sp.]
MISVVIPAYNRRESVLALLGDVCNQHGVDFEVIVVDDNSTDGTADAVRAKYQKVIVLRNEVNRGPAVTRNLGIRAARGAIVVGFDSDVRLPQNSLLRLIEQRFRALPQVTAFAFRILQADGQTEDVDRWWHPVRVEKYAARPFFTSYFSGTAYAMRREPMIAAGLFPEDIFMHYEEVELAFRLLDAGGSIMYLPEAVVHHHENKVSRRSEVKAFYKPRNQVLLAISLLPWRRAITYVAPRLTYQFLFALRHGHLGSFIRALRSAVSMTPSRLRQRRPLKPSTFRTLARLKSGSLG